MGRALTFKHPVQGVEHEPVAAERDQSRRFVTRGEGVALAEQLLTGARRLAVRGKQPDPAPRQIS